MSTETTSTADTSTDHLAAAMPIVNRVASSGLITFDLEDLYPEGERVVYDLTQHLWQGLILREQQLRDEIKPIDWSAFEGKHVAITCTADAIVPTWAFMLIALKLQPYAATVMMGTADELESLLFERALDKIDFSQYAGAKVVIKGCSKKAVPNSAYVTATARLMPYAASLMFGEPCSTVPLYKKPKASV